MSSRSAKERIQDIFNAIDSIQRRTAGMSFDQFSQDETIVKAVLYDLIVIGEAAMNIPAEVQALAPKLPCWFEYRCNRATLLRCSNIATQGSFKH